MFWLRTIVAWNQTPSNWNVASVTMETYRPPWNGATPRILRSSFRVGSITSRRDPTRSWWSTVSRGSRTSDWMEQTSSVQWMRWRPVNRPTDVLRQRSRWCVSSRHPCPLSNWFKQWTFVLLVLYWWKTLDFVLLSILATYLQCPTTHSVGYSHDRGNGSPMKLLLLICFKNVRSHVPWMHHQSLSIRWYSDHVRHVTFQTVPFKLCSITQCECDGLHVSFEMKWNITI